MLKRQLCILLVLCLLLSSTALAANNQSSPYAIRVNRALNTVTIYTQDATGAYTVPYKAMICSTARSGYTTPLGNYQLEEYRSEWRLMVDGTYAQYATCFIGNYLFHSICYTEPSHDAMIRDAYNNLGSAASMGCVRLETVDAKWIYDNCPAGTPVTVYDDPEDPGPLGKPERTMDFISETAYNGWDPTDPAEENPWRSMNVTKLTVSPRSLSLHAGETATLTVETDPKNAAVRWTSSNETVATVDAKGLVTAKSAGTTQIEVSSYNGLTATCTVRVQGELLPFDDLVPGSWYYAEVRQALEKGLFSGVGERTFAPQQSMTRAMVVQVLYNLEQKPKSPAELPFTDVAEDSWYRDAVAWAVSEGIVQGVSEAAFCPDRAMTRQELATVLWRYSGSPSAAADLTVFSDEAAIQTFARDALSWMVQQKLMQGSGDALRPTHQITRIEAAVIFQRMLKK